MIKCANRCVCVCAPALLLHDLLSLGFVCEYEAQSYGRVSYVCMYVVWYTTYMLYGVSILCMKIGNISFRGERYSGVVNT